MKLVVIESPYAATDTHSVDDNIAYARECLRDSLNRGEAPLASHLLYTQVLDDTNPAERQQGIGAGFAWNKHATLIAVYEDHGITAGMWKGIKYAVEADIPVVFRTVNSKGW